jgi:hypothetical protein
MLDNFFCHGRESESLSAITPRPRNALHDTEVRDADMKRRLILKATERNHQNKTMKEENDD